MPNLGERIYKLRSKNNMSQGELADRLEVSRQAVSKWENNVSIPELDKIAAMSELFGVSTDIIIKGVEEKKEEDNTQQPTQITIEHRESGFSRRKITQILGIVFIVLGILLAALSLLFEFAFDFTVVFLLLAVNGVLLLICKKYSWLVVLTVNALLIILFLSIVEINLAASEQEMFTANSIPDVSVISE